MNGSIPDVVTFHVARPFSSNRMYSRQTTKRGHRNLTREYKAWRDEMGWALKMEMSGVPQIACRYDMTIELPPTRMDSDNPVKPIGDLMQNIGLVTNDRNLHAFNVVPTDDRTDCLVVLTLRPDLPVRAVVKRRKVARVTGGKAMARQIAQYRKAGALV